MAKKPKREKVKGQRAWKVIGRVTKIASGIAAAKALEAAWKTATGRPVPASADHPGVPNKEAMVWAALSGLFAGMVRAYASRRVAVYWMRSTGHLPPGMPDTPYKGTATPTEDKGVGTELVPTSGGRRKRSGKA